MDRNVAIYKAGDQVFIVVAEADDPLAPYEGAQGRFGIVREAFTYYTMSTDYDVEVDGNLHVVEEQYLVSAEGE